MSARRLVVACLALFAATLAFSHVSILLGQRMAQMVGFASLFSFFIFSVGHGVLCLGRRHTAVFLGVTFLVSLAFEAVGVLTGLVYGPYAYTDRLGYKVFGLVPIVIPLAWFMMVYASYDLARLIAGLREQPRSLAGVTGLAALAALAMTAWDLTMDPRASTRMGQWTWIGGGPWFGVPIQNYLGWLLTTFAVYLFYGLFARRLPPDALGGRDGFAHLPALSYALMACSEVASGLQSDQPALALAALFSMGGFAASGAAGLLRECHGAEGTGRAGKRYR